MECERAHELMSAKLDGEIAAADAAELSNHLHECGTCGDFQADLETRDADIRTALKPYRDQANRVAERVIARLSRPHTYPNRLRRLMVPFMSAAAGFALAILLFQPWNRSNPALQNDGVTHSGLRPDTTKPPIQLAVATGPVEISDSNGSIWRIVGEGGFPLGTRVRTGPKSRCEFRCPDGCEIRMNNNTEVQFQDERAVALTKGQIWTTVAGGPAPFHVSVPEAIVTAVGTQFDVLCQPTLTVLTVLEGKTKVDSAAGSAVIKQGETAQIVKGEVVNTEAKPSYELLQSTSWVHEILVKKGQNNRELTKRIDDLFAQIGQLKQEFISEDEIRTLGDHCVIPLARYLQSDRSKKDRPGKRAQAARIIADVAQPWSVPDLLELLKDSDAEVRFHAATALKRVTRQTQGCAPDQWKQPLSTCEPSIQRWQQWWEENRERYPMPR